MTEPTCDCAARLDELEARAERQKAYLIKLRERIDALEAGPVSETSDTSPVGVFAPRRECMACGRVKEHGRNELTCRACGRARNEAIKAGGVRPSYSACGNCGSVKAPSMTLLCPPCSKSYSRWKTGQ